MRRHPIVQWRGAHRAAARRRSAPWSPRHWARRRVLGAGLACGVVLAACGSDGSPAVGDVEPVPFVGISVAGCSPVEATGSGVVVDDGVILTSAHVLRGAETITLTWPDGSSGTADVLGFDAEMDLAYLGARTDGVTPVPLDSTDVVDGDAGTAWVVRDGLLVAIDVTVLRSVQIDTEDIYVEGETRRPGWELDAVIERGDSGGPVMVDGRVVGVLWARSSLASGRSYAIDPERAGDRIARQLADGDLGPDVDVARCP